MGFTLVKPIQLHIVLSIFIKGLIMNTMKIYYDTNNEMQAFDYARYDYSNDNEHFVYTVTPKGNNHYNIHHGDFVNQHNAHKKFLLLVDKSYTTEQIDGMIEISLNVFKYNK